MIPGANPAVFMYGSGPTFGATLHHLGNADQKRLAELMVEKRWGATMVLTEPDAGSDVGAGRTRAVQQEDGSWHITGVKRFITSAEHDLSHNITHHPDVRRSLMLQKAYAEGMRALYLYTATFRDQVMAAEAEGTADSEEAVLAAKLNDLLLPIVKGFGSERATQLLTAESLQTLGGSGYLQDYPIEQYIRDSKIDTLYEGTTAIQGQDFFFRKVVRDGGVALTWLASQIQATIDAEAGNGP